MLNDVFVDLRLWGDWFGSYLKLSCSFLSNDTFSFGVAAPLSTEIYKIKVICYSDYYYSKWLIIHHKQQTFDE